MRARCINIAESNALELGVLSHNIIMYYSNDSRSVRYIIMMIILSGSYSYLRAVIYDVYVVGTRGVGVIYGRL